LYSNPYSNAGEKQQKLAIRSEQKSEERSTRRTQENAGEQAE